MTEKIWAPKIWTKMLLCLKTFYSWTFRELWCWNHALNACKNSDYYSRMQIVLCVLCAELRSWISFYGFRITIFWYENLWIPSIYQNKVDDQAIYARTILHELKKIWVLHWNSWCICFALFYQYACGTHLNEMQIVKVNSRYASYKWNAADTVVVVLFYFLSLPTFEIQNFMID